MSKTPPTKVEKALSLDFTSGKDDIWLTSQKTLRKLIGVLGVCLPILLFLTLLVDAGFNKPLFSLSHYYFTRASSIFVVIVSLLAIFLLIYKGEDRIDFYLSTIAGIFALCVVLFPTSNISRLCNDENFKYSLTIMKDSMFRMGLHYVSASIFLVCLALMSIFVFTKSNKSPDQRGRPKRIRNRIYRTCGIIMLIAIAIMLTNVIGIISNETFSKYQLVFWMEVIAIEAFGISWLTKAEVFVKG